MFVVLKPVSERKAKGHSSTDVVNDIRRRVAGISEAFIGAFPPPAISGLGTYGGFSFELQQTGGGSLEELEGVLHQFMQKASARHDLAGLFSTFSARDPQQYYVRADTGRMVPLDNLVTVKEATNASIISHYNLFRNAEITGSAAPGYSSGQAIQAMEEVAKEALPAGYTYSWTGLSYEEIKSGGQSFVLFALGLLVVYLTLSAQYESFVLPFIILLAVPMAVLGALGAQSLRGLENDVYCQIGLVMLIGLASKNAILIVEFAEQLQHRGMGLIESAIEAARLRLRPILMTSIAFIFGVLPLVFATGAGSAGRHSVGTTVFGGMIVSTFLNLFIIPILYVIVRGWLPVRVRETLPGGDVVLGHTD